MNNHQYFRITSLSYRLRAALRELASFRSGEAYTKLRTDYENIIRGLNATIDKVRQERDSLSIANKKLQGSGWKYRRISRRSMKRKQGS